MRPWGFGLRFRVGVCGFGYGTPARLDAWRVLCVASLTLSRPHVLAFLRLPFYDVLKYGCQGAKWGLVKHKMVEPARITNTLNTLKKVRPQPCALHAVFVGVVGL